MGRALILLVVLLAAVFSGIGCTMAPDSSNTRVTFANPPAEYSSAPFWVWNDTMTDELVISTLRDLAGQGIRQVFIHPRPGLTTPYLSQEWFRLWKVALAEAKRLGIIVWLYDENSYPSGFAGGFVPKQMPESRGIGLKIEEVNQPIKLSGDIVGVYRLNGNNYENIIEKVRVGEANEQSKCLVARVIQAKPGAMFANGPYVNLLTAGVTEKFLEITLDAYKREIGEEFGKSVPGVFTDEPHILPAGGQAWSNDLPQVFEKRWGYSLVDNLPALIRQAGDWKRVRHNYHATLLELYIERWAKPYYEYCEKNNLEFTGHYWEHQWPGCGGVPDNMAMSAWMHRPGIDILFNQYGEGVRNQFGNVRSVIEIASIANQMGRKRTLCETYGGAGWELRFEDMKRIGDWIYVLGINTMNEHLSYASMRGSRKADYPQSFSYQEPWWQGYHVAAGYFARLSAALSQGEQINEILVMEPTSTAWMYQPDASQKNYVDRIGSEFQRTVVSLAKQQVEFDIGCEDIIGHNGSVDGAALKVGRRAYTTIVLPALMENLNSRTIELLEKYAANGGQVICCGDAPTLVDGQASERPGILAKSVGFRKTAAGDLASVLLSQSKNGFSIKQSEDNNSILFHQRRKLEDGELVFAVNTDIKSACKGIIESAGRSIEKWDAETGTISPYAYEKSERGVKAQFDLAPAGSILLFISNKPIEPAQAKPAAETTIKSAGPMKIKRNAPNVLTLDYLDLTLGEKTTPKIYYNKAAQMTFAQYSMKENPWDHAVQYEDELISKKFDPNSGFEAAYYFTIKDSVPKPIYAVIEKPEFYTITCNGKAVKAKKGSWWLDKSFGKIDISSVVKTGENKITIMACPFTVYEEIAAIYVLGDFRVEPNDSGFVIVRDEPMQMGPWNKQGYSLYGDSVSYKQQFKVQQTGGRSFVRLTDWYGSVAKVIVNGKEAGYIWHQPWQCDVTGQIKKGSNEIEVIVIGTLKNTLGLHHSGQPGRASPSDFREAPPNGPPAGSKYKTIGYGLFEPFELVMQ
jgi:hypothetical protein